MTHEPWCAAVIAANSELAWSVKCDCEPVMTPKQYAHAISQLGLSQRAAGKFLGVDERNSRRWIAGDSPIPVSAAKLLRLMIRLNLKPEDVK